MGATAIEYNGERRKKTERLNKQVNEKVRRYERSRETEKNNENETVQT